MGTTVTDLFYNLTQTLQTKGAPAAIEALCTTLRERKDFTGLFYALLMKKRHEMGVSPMPTGSALALPNEFHADYEKAIREAATTVGKLSLEAGNIPEAWVFYRMLGETDPVREALDKTVVVEGEDCQPLVDIAYHQGVHPTKGFDLVLQRFGICSAITLLGGHEFPHGPEVRDYCLKCLVRALHAELLERLACEIERVQNFRPTSKNVPEVLAGRDWLFEEGGYHIDPSHLSAVVQMSVHLPPSPELEIARELCVYGQRLPETCQYNADPPFEDFYRDYALYLGALAGDNVEAALMHFRAKMENYPAEEVGTYVAEVFVNLLLKLGKSKEAVGVARQYLSQADSRQMTCPGIIELCEQAGDYETLAEVARERNNAVHFLAGLLSREQGKSLLVGRAS
jgi:hypothetical protein